MRPLVTSAVAGGSLVAGFAVASATGTRALGGLVLLVAAAGCARAWQRAAGRPAAAALLLLYAAAFVLSHVLARLTGAWAAVLTVAAVVAAGSHAVLRRPGRLAQPGRGAAARPVVRPPDRVPAHRPRPGGTMGRSSGEEVLDAGGHEGHDGPASR